MTKQKDPFEGLDPKDGFRVKQVDFPTKNPTSISLHICAYVGGELQNIFPDRGPEEATVEIKEWKHPTPEDMGACNRLQLVLDAICRYLNTGGNWEELTRAMVAMKTVAFGGLVFPGYHLLESQPNSDNDYEHIFVKDGTDRAVLWVEDCFIDRFKALEQIKREREEDLWPAPTAEPDDPEEEIEGEPGQPHAGNLLALTDRRHEAADHSEPDDGTGAVGQG